MDQIHSLYEHQIDRLKEYLDKNPNHEFCLWDFQVAIEDIVNDDGSLAFMLETNFCVDKPAQALEQDQKNLQILLDMCLNSVDSERSAALIIYNTDVEITRDFVQKAITLGKINILNSLLEWKQDPEIGISFFPNFYPFLRSCIDSLENPILKKICSLILDYRSSPKLENPETTEEDSLINRIKANLEQ